MPNTHDQIEARIKSFVTELNDLVRRAAIEAVQDVLGGQAPRRGPGRPRGSVTKVAAAAPSAPKARARKGGKRPPALLAKTVAAVRDYVSANPGKRVEQIAPALATSTKDLALPITKLLASKHLRREGRKRATKYFPGPKAKSALPS